MPYFQISLFILAVKIAKNYLQANSINYFDVEAIEYINI